ncbi:MAG: outer membrane lipoprotein-sorting protein [Flavobacteriaceae bacterium]
MKKLNKILLTLLLFFPFNSFSQSVDEIIDNYFENTGGIDQWRKLKGVKMSAKLSQQGMEIPIEIIQMQGGKQMQIINFQGQSIKAQVFDGEVSWGINMMSQKPEKSDQETTDNLKLDNNDFPDSFMDYKSKGYTAELIGKETVDGTETFKVKLTKEPKTVDGKKEDDITFYFFDTENYVPIAIQTEVKEGPGKGMIMEITMSDYQEVEGLYFPFSQTQGIKDQPSIPLIIDSIELNPTIEEKEFKFPEN